MSAIKAAGFEKALLSKMKNHNETLEGSAGKSDESGAVSSNGGGFSSCYFCRLILSSVPFCFQIIFLCVVNCYVEACSLVNLIFYTFALSVLFFRIHFRQ